MCIWLTFAEKVLSQVLNDMINRSENSSFFVDLYFKEETGDDREQVWLILFWKKSLLIQANHTKQCRIILTLVVLYRMFLFIICLILMNYLMEFYFIGFVNAHLPGCFCPWTFRLNIGLNTSPSDSFVSYLNSHLGYSAGEFQALQLIVLAVFGAVD